MIGSFPKKRWYLYDDMSGNIVLKHPYRASMKVLCPHCDKAFVIENYRTECCNHHFKIRFGEICQVEPIGRHGKTEGRGWSSLRPYEK